VDLVDSRHINYTNLERTMEVSAEFQGWDITNSAIKVTFSKVNNGKVIYTKIGPSNPWRLVQLQNCVYYLQMCVQIIEEQFQEFDPDGVADGVKQNLPLSSVSSGISSIFSLIRQAKDQLLLPIRITFPKNSQTASMFNPPIPNEMLADFKIKNKMLVVTCAIMVPITKPAQKAVDNPLTKSGEMTQFGNKKTFYSKRHNQYYEIIDQIAVEVKVPKIETIYRFIQTCWEVCSDFRQKLLLTGVY